MLIINPDSARGQRLVTKPGADLLQEATKTAS
jgi:hypothetical protein